MNWFRRLFTRPAPVTVYHVRAMPLDTERRRRAMTERLARHVGGDALVQEYRERGII